MTDTLPLLIQPVIRYPKEAEVGKTYLMEIDLQIPESGFDWQYEEEEYLIYCMVNARNLFTVTSVGEPSIMLHRFCGTYGSAKFLLEADIEEKSGSLTIVFVNQWGNHIRSVNCAVILQKTPKISSNLINPELLLQKEIKDNALPVDLKVFNIHKSKGTDSDLVEKFQSASHNLQLFPLLTKEERDNFLVDYGNESIDILEQKVLDCNENTNHFLFAGHRGCGKSTLLYSFARQMEEHFFTVSFSIAELIEMQDINHITILFAITFKMMEKAEQENVKISKHKKQAFNDWFKKITRTGAFELKGYMSDGLSLLDAIKSKLLAEQITREEIKIKFMQNLRDLIDTLNAIATEIKLATKSEILVIVDDLDKTDLAQINDIFHKNLKALLQTKFIVIYTVPISMIHDINLKTHVEHETGNHIFVMPVLKLYPKGESRKSDGKPNAHALQVLKSVLMRRITPDLLESGIEEKIVLMSGGVLREAIKIAKLCCGLILIRLRKKLRNRENIQDVRIDNYIVDEAFDDIRNDMKITLSRRDRQILLQVYYNYAPEDPKDQEFLDLLHNGVIIEYRNRQTWYDIHPLMVEQLRIEKLIE
ncbi:P-loop NTPase fold protein [Pseudanabaena sp. ABRG5-3]|uniref:P-loop NTPase fold protein n=1 Tax=Pseudanabaena sp. ABRG5-3 TaxID=685565 RepID=UPI000DC6E22F|nr:P-loop NTPase fold protein [Pseudanabaena sp. ABRG5-3]BBC24154.1 AAA ATPase [Pseudanabaena sp. ABRG5-3]